MSNRIVGLFLGLAVVGLFGGGLSAQDIRDKTPRRWVTVTAQAAGTTQKSKDQAVARALRQAVEQGCGVFLKAQSKSKNYKGIYDKVFADAVGYVREHEVLKTWIEDDCYHARVRALVSTQKFRKDWSAIAHTYHQEGNPRVIIVIGQSTYEMVKELEVERDHASAGAVAVRAESHRRAAAAEGGVAAREGEAAAVTGRFRRRGRVRPRNWAVMSEAERAVWLRRAEAEEHSSATVVGASAHKSSRSTKTWRRIAMTIKEGGPVQAEIERFFLDKGIKLMDRATVGKVNKRDLMLASAKDDLAEVAALGARFNADVIILGSAAAKGAGETEQTVAGKAIKQYDYTAKLVVRVIRTDSAQLMASRVYTARMRSTRKSGGEEKALDKLARDAGPKLLADVVEAWRKQVNVTRDVKLHITGMTYKIWKTFRNEVNELPGVKFINLREITESVANIDVGYEFTTQNLVESLSELKSVKLEVTEFNPNRIKLKIVK